MRNELRAGHDLEGDRLDRPPYAWLAVAVGPFTAVLALPVGRSLIIDPTGAAVGMPLKWIEGSVFGTYLVPGIFLLGMNGVAMVVLAVFALAGQRLAPWLTGALGWA